MDYIQIIKSTDCRRHVLGSQQFNKEFLNELFEKTDQAKRGIYEKSLTDKTVALLFYEPSTRTRFSFDKAVHLLGGHVISTENAKEFSSAVKGESLEDTVRVVAGYAHIIVIRHFEEGSSAIASQVSRVPIINAGDGTGQHPTQSLLDVYTIKDNLGRLDNLNIVMVGDLKRGRTVRSLAYLLSKYDGNKMFFVSSAANSIKIDILNHLKENNVAYVITDDLESVLREADVVYMTRTQKERFTEDEKAVRGVSFIIDSERIKLMKERAILLHPLPRNEEISPDVDNNPRAKYFEQSDNGVFVRTALLDIIAKYNL